MSAVAFLVVVVDDGGGGVGGSGGSISLSMGSQDSFVVVVDYFLEYVSRKVIEICNARRSSISFPPMDSRFNSVW